MFWLNMLHIRSMFFQLLCFIVEYCVRKISLKAAYGHDFHLRKGEIHRLYYESDETCINQLRMNINTFTKLCDMLEKIGPLKYHFRHLGETANRHFNDVLHVVLCLQGELFNKP